MILGETTTGQCEASNRIDHQHHLLNRLVSLVCCPRTKHAKSKSACREIRTPSISHQGGLPEIATTPCPKPPREGRATTGCFVSGRRRIDPGQSRAAAAAPGGAPAESGKASLQQRPENRAQRRRRPSFSPSIHHAPRPSPAAERIPHHLTSRISIFGFIDGFDASFGPRGRRRPISVQIALGYEPGTSDAIEITLAFEVTTPEPASRPRRKRRGEKGARKSWGNIPRPEKERNARTGR